MIYNKQEERDQIKKQLAVLFAENGTNLREICINYGFAYSRWVYMLDRGHLPHDELQDMVKATNPSYAAFNNNGTIQIRKR